MIRAVLLNTDSRIEPDMLFSKPERNGPPLIGEVVLCGPQYNFAVDDKCQLVRKTVDIGEDMGRIKHRTFAAFHDLEQHIKNLGANDRVQPRCRLVEKQQPW